MAGFIFVTRLVNEALILLVGLADIGSLFNIDNLKEEVLQYEKLRLDAISRHKRKISGNSVHKNTEQRSAILPRTRRVLPMQNGINDASQYKDTGSRRHPSEHVRYEPRTVWARKRPFDIDNGR